MTSAPRVLFRVSNRRGLGHFMRATNLAKALRALAPAADVRMLLRRAAPPELLDPATRVWVEGIGGEPLEGWRPDVVVRDTLPDEDVSRAEAGSRQVFVVRRSKEERQREILAHPQLAAADLLLVPHSEEEFGDDLPPALRPRAAFVGPIVRRSTEAGRARVAERYDTRSEDFLLVSSVGGGGFTEPARAFFETVFRAHEGCRRRRGDLRHVVVRGPYFGEPLRPPPGVELVETVADLVDLFALAHLVVAEGGYNTVHELLATGTPGVFLPAPRGADDQAARVAEIAAAGLGFVAGGDDPARRAERVVAVATDAAALAACRERHAVSSFRPGNGEAARRILELVS